MIFRHARQVRETHDIGLRVSDRQATLRRHVNEFGQDLHRKLGTAGLLASGVGAGFLFDRLRPHWRGLYSTGGLGMALVRFAPLANALSRILGRPIAPD